MGSLRRDILQAVFMGMIVPYLILSFAVKLWERERGTVPVFETTAEEPAGTERDPVTVLLRTEDGTVRTMELEEYLTGVILAEMPADFEQEALKAQAVAARTFARKAGITGGKHGDGSLCAQSGCCQGYITTWQYLMNGGTDQNLNRVRRAVADTAGEVLTYEGELIEATYFACSGGKTEDAAAVWGAEYPYLVPVDSPGEEQAAHYRDTVCFTPQEFQTAIGRQLTGEPAGWFRNLHYTSGGGVESVEIGGEAYTGTELRGLLGLRSTAFSITITRDAIQLETKGYGHRVGMSQYGADAMAVSGSDYREILGHYYPGTDVETPDA